MSMPVESHPLKPFLPAHARILMLGSFPPKRERWSMDWFYPNWLNDMWRIMGHIFYNDKNHFVVEAEKRFDKERIVSFCTEKGIAIYDAASEVRRLRDNASDEFLEVVTPTDIAALLEQMPQCQVIVTTGQKATDVVVSQLGIEQPRIGDKSCGTIGSRPICLWRMPSSSRAYPLKLEKKADFYRTMLSSEGIIP